MARGVWSSCPYSTRQIAYKATLSGLKYMSTHPVGGKSCNPDEVYS